MATAVDAARTVSPFRAAYTEAAVADFVFERRTRKIIIKVLERRFGDVGKRLVREKRLMRCDDHIGHRNEQRERFVLSRHVRTVFVEPFALLFIDIKTRAADRSVAQRRQQRL